MRLFCECARAAHAPFHLTPSLTPIVAQICRELDGLPLAIELAAAHSRLFTPQELLQRLEHRLPLLDQSAIDRPLHQQGLERAIAWSYATLAPPQQVLLTRLAIFAGSFNLAAVEAVCANGSTAPQTPVEPPALDTALGIGMLLDQSLLMREPAHRFCVGTAVCCQRCATRQLRDRLMTEPRFEMLAIIREFARERLHASGELPQIAQRHAAYYAGWAVEVGKHLHGPDQGIWLARLEREVDNLRMALTTLLAGGCLEPAAQLVCALGSFWQRHGYYSEGCGWLEQITARLADSGLPAALRAQTLQIAAMLAYRQGSWQAATEELRASLTLYQAVGDGRGTARVLFDLAWIALDRAAFAEAARLSEESLARTRQIDDEVGVYRALTNLGWAQLCLGRREEAAGLFGEACELARRLGHTRGVAISLVNQGWIALDEGALVDASRLVAESLRLCHLLGEREVLVEGLEILSAVAVAQQRMRHAATIGGAAAALWERLHVSCPPTKEAITVFSQAQATLRDQRADPELAAAWSRGRAMSLDAVVVFALHSEDVPEDVAVQAS